MILLNMFFFLYLENSKTLDEYLLWWTMFPSDIREDSLKMISYKQEEVQNDEKVLLQIAKQNRPAKMDDL